mgnify:CR=1 FL=1
MTRTIKYTMRIRFFLPALLLPLLWSCQSPMERAPIETRDVLVHVQDAAGRPVELVPVEVQDLRIPEAERTAIDRQVTDRTGNTYFRFEIPTTGAPYRFLVGDAETGITTVDANLLCRDTLLIVRLASEEIPCSGIIERTIRIEDICAPLNTGQTFTDSTQMVFRSGCDVPLTFSISGPDDSPALSLFVLNAQGGVVTDRPFVLLAGGQFTLRAVATPQDSGLQVVRYQLTGSGPNQAAVTINLTVEIDARNCNTCDCPDDEILVDFGTIQSLPPTQRGEGRQVVDLLRNTCLFDRIDNIIKEPTIADVFRVTPLVDEVAAPGERSSMTVTFTPNQIGAYRDTILVEHFLPGEQRRCTTRVILTGSGCGPECELLEDPRLVERDPPGSNQFDFDLGRVRVYTSGNGMICFENVGGCGTLVLNASALEGDYPGFSLTRDELELDGEEQGCFTVRFEASDEVVWPDGHGQPAKILHDLPLRIDGCGPVRDVTVRVVVDTLPILFSRCIYRWDQNENYGYNFTPVQGKGEDRFDPNAPAQQLSDLVVAAVDPNDDADVYIRSGWKFIKAGVSEDQFNYTDMSTGQNGWSRAEFESITSPGFSTSQAATLDFRSVYSIRIERDGVISYACVRVREVSVDPDGKYKMCLDVLYPMIKEN